MSRIVICNTLVENWDHIIFPSLSILFSVPIDVTNLCGKYLYKQIRHFGVQPYHKLKGSVVRGEALRQQNNDNKRRKRLLHRIRTQN